MAIKSGRRSCTFRAASIPQSRRPWRRSRCEFSRPVPVSVCTFLAGSRGKAAMVFPGGLYERFFVFQSFLKTGKESRAVNRKGKVRSDFLLLLLVICTGVLLTACGGGGMSAPPPRTLSSLKIAPQSPLLKVGATQ